MPTACYSGLIGMTLRDVENYRRSLCLYAFVFVTVSFCSCISSRMTLDSSIDALMAPYALSDGPGAAVLVMQNDSVLFRKAYGLAECERREPVRTTTNFRLASVTKEFTAMCIMILARRHLLSYDDTLGRYFPGLPSYGRAITIRQLLTHTSGIPDYEDLIPDTQTVQVHDRDCLALVAQADSTYFPPGTAYRYSNTGYALLALIAESVSGKRFADLLTDEIFSKVGMSNSVAFEDGISTVENRAYGYARTGDAWIRADQSVTSAVLGDGGIYSSVEDLSRWVAALYHHRLIDAGTQTIAWRRGTLNDGRAIDYGYGWHIEDLRGIAHPYHGGSTRGFRNAIQLFPDRHLMIVILTNRDEGDPAVPARAIADLVAH